MSIDVDRTPVVAPGVVIRGAQVGAGCRDVRLVGHRIAAVDRAIAPEAGDIVIDGQGGALIPGLHDHHVHLLAMAAAARSVAVGPPGVRSAEQLAAALAAADRRLAAGEWLRATGYHESVAGPLDRGRLDELVPDRPARVQHRSGALWILNSLALGLTGLDGHATGRLFGQDAWLRSRVPAVEPDLTAVGTMLTAYGVTGVTDATPTTDATALDVLAAAVTSGALPQHVVITGAPGLDPSASPVLRRGPAKVVLADHALPTLDEVLAAIATARRARRTVAVHCVTRDALALALAAFGDAGAWPGDRIEHGAVVPPDMAASLASHGLTVVTQPNFIRERGDQYIADVEADDLAHLYPCLSLIDAGVAVGGGTDAPFGHADPWRAIAAAVDRATETGRVLGPHERISAGRALALFLTPPEAPGGAPRRIEPGACADVCLLAAPLADVLAAPSSDAVVLTVRAGVVRGPGYT
jgi:predicted amidohydrolase YtcJ